MIWAETISHVSFESAQIIKDNKQDFEELMTQVDKTKHDAKKTMADTD